MRYTSAKGPHQSTTDLTQLSLPRAVRFPSKDKVTELAQIDWCGCRRRRCHATGRLRGRFALPTGTPMCRFRRSSVMLMLLQFGLSAAMAMCPAAYAASSVDKASTGRNPKLPRFRLRSRYRGRRPSGVLAAGVPERVLPGAKLDHCNLWRAPISPCRCRSPHASKVHRPHRQPAL